MTLQMKINATKSIIKNSRLQNHYGINERLLRMEITKALDAKDKHIAELEKSLKETLHEAMSQASALRDKIAELEEALKQIVNNSCQTYNGDYLATIRISDIKRLRELLE